MLIIFALKKGELKEKTQDGNFSLPIKNSNSLLKKRIPDSDSKLAKNWVDFGFGLPTLDFTIFLKIK